MYEGFLNFGGVEIISAARTRAYAKKFMPALDFKCDETALDFTDSLGPSTTPADDNAPWYRPDVPATGDFYGFFPAKVDGGSDSTYTIPSTELLGDGGVFGVPRNKSLETRWTVVGLAKSEEAMEYGMTWLTRALTGLDQVASLGSCIRAEMAVLKAPAFDSASLASLTRTYYDVGVIVAPTVTVKTRSSSGFAWHVTFTLRAGNPAAFTNSKWSGSTVMSTGSATHNDPSGQNCSVQSSAYNNFINDPFYTAISKPPQPPTIKPPNLLPITSWRRKTINIPSEFTTKGSFASPVIAVSSGADPIRQLRLRIYRTGQPMTTCPEIGEFYISYVPALSSIQMDSRKREITVSRNGKVSPGSHLVFGSDGNPYSWPVLNHGHAYTIVADMMPPSVGINSSASVLVDLYLKET